MFQAILHASRTAPVQIYSTQPHRALAMREYTLEPRREQLKDPVAYSAPELCCIHTNVHAPAVHPQLTTVRGVWLRRRASSGTGG